MDQLSILDMDEWEAGVSQIGGRMHTVGQGGLHRGSPEGLVKRGGGHE
jgi:hypothetical protein